MKEIQTVPENPIAFLLERLLAREQETAIVFEDRDYSCAWLLQEIDQILNGFTKDKIAAGDGIGLVADFTPRSIAVLLALISNRNLILPLLRSTPPEITARHLAIAGLTRSLHLLENDRLSLQHLAGEELKHAFYDELRRRRTPGLVLLTSGSSGTPKAAVHDFGHLLNKFHLQRPALRTLGFLLFDHWGGLNTLLHTLSSNGTVFTIKDRKPDTIGSTIAKHRIEVLPASPTFLQLLLLSQAHRRFDLSSLKIISYGTEPMPNSLLLRLAKEFPNVKLQQTYGLIELGVLRSKSKSDDSLWVKLGGEGVQVRVIDGLLEIKSNSTMLGYLNAPSPFTEDGWFKTGDAVEVDGEYFRILGRRSEMINVGGEKVFPQQVESVILELPDVAEVTVFGEKNPLMGNIVCARIRLTKPMEVKAIEKQIRDHCQARLLPYQVPVKIFFEDQLQHSERLKKSRRRHE